ncbi:hypothetical protein G6F60_015510 [Rhizopus arrhizus]|nr:hypothetical protein G6F24_017864 [Rhizopus arrhizus]KAG1374316.1 hypothetical protein G6F60_015510 [Rhizopus arrhizus]
MTARPAATLPRFSRQASTADTAPPTAASSSATINAMKYARRLMALPPSPGGRTDAAPISTRPNMPTVNSTARPSAIKPHGHCFQCRR